MTLAPHPVADSRQTAWQTAHGGAAHWRAHWIHACRWTSAGSYQGWEGSSNQIAAPHRSPRTQTAAAGPQTLNTNVKLADRNLLRASMINDSVRIDSTSCFSSCHDLQRRPFSSSPVLWYRWLSFYRLLHIYLYVFPFIKWHTIASLLWYQYCRTSRWWPISFYTFLFLLFLFCCFHDLCCSLVSIWSLRVSLDYQAGDPANQLAASPEVKRAAAARVLLCTRQISLLPVYLPFRGHWL